MGNPSVLDILDFPLGLPLDSSTQHQQSVAAASIYINQSQTYPINMNILQLRSFKLLRLQMWAHHKLIPPPLSTSHVMTSALYCRVSPSIPHAYDDIIFRTPRIIDFLVIIFMLELGKYYHVLFIITTIY